MPLPRGLAVAILLLLTTSGGSLHVAAESTTETIRYLLPTGVVTSDDHYESPVGVDTCPALCPLTGEPLVVGDPLFVIGGAPSTLTVRFLDDFHGGDVASAVCLSAAADGLCLPSDTFIGPLCGGYILTVTPPPAEMLVFGYSVVLDEDMAACGTTKGYATITYA